MTFDAQEFTEGVWRVNDPGADEYARVQRDTDPERVPFEVRA